MNNFFDIYKISFSLKHIRNVSFKAKKVSAFMSKPPSINFLSNTLGLSAKRCRTILEENAKLLDVNRKDLCNTVDYLKRLKYSVNDIEEKPMILYVNCLTLANRYGVLAESGCKNISLQTLFKYVTVMNKEICILKNHGILDEKTDVQRNLEKCFDSDIAIRLNEKLNDDIMLRSMREKILNVYLTEKLQLTKQQLEKQWKTYGRIRHKSFESVVKIINLLINELNFPIDRIINNGYLLYGDPENLMKLITGISTIGSQNFKEILYRRPKIIMSSFESVFNTIEHIRNFGITDDAILRCLEIFTLGSETVLERLNDIKNINQLQALISNPRILRLVHYQNKALKRLDYLNNMKVKCASLHILSCDSNAFVRFAREGTDRNKGKDVIVYLSNIFKVTVNQVRKELSKHPSWCHVPISEVKECFELLQQKYFSHSDILANIHILFYPKHRIEEKLKILHGEEFYVESQLDTSYTYVSFEKILTLCLYLIELDFHFTGDGIWTDQYANVENFKNFIPDFLEQKIYKYGGKPSKQNQISETVM